MSFSGLTPHFISPSCSAQPSPLASLTASTSHEPLLRTTHAETTHADVSASADAVAPHTAASLDDAALHTIRALIFDLDGTLLDTLPHLTALTNFVLAQQHFPQHTQEEVLSYIGEGGQKLLMRAAPKNTPQDVIDAMFQQWKEKFYTHGIDLVAPFEGINDMLATLKTRTLLGVLSNKFDAGCIASVQQHFPNTFCWVHGERAGIPRKPQPDGLQNCLDELQLHPDEAIYVGDSVTDIDAARSAGMRAIGVSWGYQDSRALLEHGASYLAKSPCDLLTYVEPLLFEHRI
jgi:hypothetical protein